ncbi:hypothetical protein DIPPA_20894 [Diplonema papillatum]|nr:hypothetical protein DIPPA_20894 [Diplonema papillatum]
MEEAAENSWTEPTASVVADWRDERVVVAEDDVEVLVKKVFEALNYIELDKTGAELTDLKHDVSQALESMECIDLGKAELVERRIDDAHAELDRQQKEADAAVKAAREVDFTLKMAEQEADWAEVKELPAMLAKRSGFADLQSWQRTIEKAEKQRDEVGAQATAARLQAEDLRTLFHYLLHKVSHVASSTERLVFLRIFSPGCAHK